MLLFVNITILLSELRGAARCNALYRAQDALFALGQAGNTRGAPVFNFVLGID
jgi:hypothetical protein